MKAKSRKCFLGIVRVCACIGIAACVALPSLARAGELGINAGLLGGFSTALPPPPFTGSNVGGFGLGVRAGYNLFPKIEVGAEWVYQSTTPSAAQSGYSSNLSLIMANFDFHFTGLMSTLLDPLFAGVKLGLASTSGGGSMGSSFAAGGELGYDYMLVFNISVGAQLNLVYVTAPTINASAGSSGTVFQALAAIKYHL